MNSASLIPPARQLFVSLACLLAAGSQAVCAAEPPTAEALDFFEKKIRPVLIDKCYKCHSSESESLKGGLLLDSREGWLKGGETGPALVPGNPDKSLGIAAIRYTEDDMLMPPKKSGGKLPANVIADFESWVSQGAPWPPETKANKKVARFDLQERKQQHWCWKPPVAPLPPTVKSGSWAQSAVDGFILAQLEAKNLKPAPATDRTALLRRLCFDIIGLPPTPEETTAFLNDTAPNAVEKVVDRLLASPHYGERWARHWMDLVRYAEGRGHEFDPPIANAWQYRDYLIRTLNADIPYPEFVKEHIAGDLLPARLNPKTGGNESILGTGFWFLGEEVHSPVDIRQDEADRMDNRLDVMAKSFLGLTVTCARCHDHKFDAISQKDYYALTGFLLSSSNRQVRFETMETEAKIAAELASLGTEAQAALLPAFASAARHGIQSVKTYLLAARNCFLKDVDARGTDEEAGSRAANAYAEKAQLDPKILGQWLRELKAAESSPAHPLHLFAATTLSADSSEPAFLAGQVHAILERQSKTSTVTPAGNPPRIIADYTKPEITPWIQDGFAFGLHPSVAGEMPLPQSGLTSAEIVIQPAARRQSLWKNIKPVGEPESGTLKEYNRSGQTLRTPEITLENGQVWYLAKGAGRAYAVVDSHIMIQGPLHGKLLTKWKSTPGWEWVPHNLTDYKGHRLHIELIPDGTDDLEIAMVVESAQKPPVPPADYPGQAAVEEIHGSVGETRALEEVNVPMIASSVSDAVPDRAPLV
ncbi:MAG: DUF1549 domain-containing protein [Verrucomicrobia bacterium]|nr:DUF1549 domain-containing protein [Verrucomicrobiota bacterium]